MVGLGLLAVNYSYDFGECHTAVCSAEDFASWTDVLPR
jgi:hypothetical protein